MNGDFDADRIRQTSEDLLEREFNYKEALRLLLDWQRDREGHHVALPASMGTSKSYLVSVSLGWIAANVYFARDLPIFKKYLRKDSMAIDINDVTTAYLQQRAPDYTRQLPMAMYLATRKHHKFPSLLLVAYQDWVYDEAHDMWDPHGRARENSLNVEGLDTKACVVDLDVANTQYFALDGQHRLMAIKGLKDLLDNGRLSARKKDGTAIVGKDVTRDEIEGYFEEQGLDPNELQSTMDEVMGVEIIPAVQTRETFRESVSRLRNVFVDVNENAKRLEKGELTLLDENDAFRIVARTVMTKHPLFKDGGGGLNVDTKSNQIPERSPNYTVLNALVSIAQAYLGERPEFNGWKDTVLDLKGRRGVGPLRPTDGEIEKGLTQLSMYFDALAKLTSHQSMILHFSSDAQEGKSPAELRGGSDKNILFRPIAQVALARAIARLQKDKGADLGDLMEILACHEESGEFDLANKKAPWFGILCDTIEGKVRRQKRYEDLCVEMMIYLLGGGFDDDEQRRKKLFDGFFEARIGGEDSGEPVAWDLSGHLKTDDEFSLPNPWR